MIFSRLRSLSRSGLAAGLLLGLPLLGRAESAATPTRALGEAWQLITDRSIVETLSGASLRLGTPVEREVVLRSDRPWEGRALMIGSIYRQDDRYYMIYRGENRHLTENDPEGLFLCLATSVDGLTWTKPDLGLVSYEGSKANNIAGTAEGKPLNWMLTFHDPRPDTPASERVKAIDMRDGDRRAGGAGKGLRAHILGSPDGSVWHELPIEADLRSDWPNAFDGGSVFWSEAEQQFVGYFRWWDTQAPRHARTFDDWMIPRPGVRSVFRSVSKDLKTWSAPEPIGFGDTPREHIYEAAVVPYFRAPELYVVLANRFNPGRRALTLDEERVLDIARTPGNASTPTYTFASDANDLVLMATHPGSLVFDRPFLEAFLRPGPELGNWSSRNTYSSLTGGILPTGPSELSFYVTRHHLQKDNYIQRISLRTDGFLSVNAPYAGGEMTTVPVTFIGDHLELNFSTSGAGEIKVELQDADGKPLPGFTLDDCDPLIGDRVGHTVSWRGRKSVAGYIAKPVRLHFRMFDADLYAFAIPGPK